VLYELAMCRVSRLALVPSLLRNFVLSTVEASAAE
jgi:hypothetical protein